MIALLAALALGAPGGPAPAPSGASSGTGSDEPASVSTGVPDRALEARIEALSRQIRCPVCQGSSIADSPSSMAVRMKDEVREQLTAGQTEEQILARLERSYGEQIRLEPRPTGVNLFLFLAPAVALMVGLLAAWRLLGRKGGP